MAEELRSIHILITVDTNKRTITRELNNLPLDQIDQLPRLVEELLPRD